MEVYGCRKEYIHGAGASGGVEGRGCGAITGNSSPTGGSCSCITRGNARGMV
jgi:hypothetical protein